MSNATSSFSRATISSSSGARNLASRAAHKSPKHTRHLSTGAEFLRPLVKVLLSGEGADELMGGYVRFYYAAMRPKVKPLLPLLARLPGMGEKWSRNFRPDVNDATDFFILSSMHLQPQHLLAIRPDANLGRGLDIRRDIFGEGQGEHLSNCLKYEMQTYMVDLLLRQDRMTMAHSLENRVPFLDRDLIALVRSVSPSLLVGSGLSLQDRRMQNTKMLLKSLAGRYFPPEFVYRSKSGFSLPLLDYYRDPRFFALMEERVLPGMKRRGLTDPEPVRNWWNNIDRMPLRLTRFTGCRSCWRSGLSSGSMA